MVDVVYRTAEQVFIPLTVGGGFARSTMPGACCARRRQGQRQHRCRATAELISEIADEFGSQCCVCAIDAKGARVVSDSMCTCTVAAPTGIDALDWAVRSRLGAGEILLTSMDRDGTRDGYDLDLTSAVAENVNVPVIASGGVGTMQHLVDGIIEGGATGVLAASIFHFGEHVIADAKAAMVAAGIAVRPVSRN
jgi:cyclase